MQKYYAQNADKEIRQWMEEKRHCALKMMASAPLASGASSVANTNTNKIANTNTNKITNTNTNTNKIGRCIQVRRHNLRVLKIMVLALLASGWTSCTLHIQTNKNTNTKTLAKSDVHLNTNTYCPET